MRLRKREKAGVVTSTTGGKVTGFPGEPIKPRTRVTSPPSYKYHSNKCVEFPINSHLEGIAHFEHFRNKYQFFLIHSYWKTGLRKTNASNEVEGQDCLEGNTCSYLLSTRGLELLTLSVHKTNMKRDAPIPTSNICWKLTADPCVYTLAGTEINREEIAFRESGTLQ